MARELIDRQLERWALVRRTDVCPRTKLAIFVHGYRGSYLSTWGQLSDYLQNDADDHPGLATWDYLFIGYDTDSIGSFLNIAKLISTYWRKATDAVEPFKSNYLEVALFGHSLGTLGIRQLLCAISQQPPGMGAALRSVGLFASPINGSSLAWLGRLGKIQDFCKKSHRPLFRDHLRSRTH